MRGVYVNLESEASAEGLDQVAMRCGSLCVQLRACCRD